MNILLTDVSKFSFVRFFLKSLVYLGFFIALTVLVLLILMTRGVIPAFASTYDTGGVDASTGNTHTLNLTLDASADVLICGIQNGGGSFVTSGVTAGGDAMTYVDRIVNTGNNQKTDVYYLEAPPTGSISIVSTTANSGGSVYTMCDSFIGAGTFDSYDTDSISGGSLLTLATTVNDEDSVLSFVSAQNGTLSANSNTTVTRSYDSYGSAYQTATSTGTLSQAFNANSFAIALSMIFEQGSPTTTPTTTPSTVTISTDPVQNILLATFLLIYTATYVRRVFYS